MPGERVLESFLFGAKLHHQIEGRLLLARDSPDVLLPRFPRLKPNEPAGSAREAGDPMPGSRPGASARRAETLFRV